ncbi:MAG: methylmalonyl Co-A mutase-associated GTPase MeaB [Terracidiphilus sp.]
MTDLPDADESSLHIKPGCAAPAPPNETKRVARHPQSISAAQYVESIRKGDRSALAKAITLIESSRPADRQLAEQIIEKCLTASGKSIRVGITGVPGAGKSSLIEALGRYLIKERGENVAVLAIDPSSQLSGGSILGDKTRMNFLASSDMAFIRPTPARGAHGGVAQHTREAIVLCEAAGYQNILVETVGIGQSEAAVREIVDFFLLVTLAGAGDELQGIKRGVMELANAVVINKADGNNIRAAERARTEAESALHFLPAPPSGWVPRALACSTQTGRGVADLWACVLDYVASTRESGWFEHWRQEQARRSMPEDLAMGLMYLFRSDPRVQERLMELEQQVLAGRITPDAAVCDLLTLFASRATQPAKHK